MGGGNSGRSKYEGDFNAIRRVAPPLSEDSYGPPDISTEINMDYGPPDLSTPQPEPSFLEKLGTTFQPEMNAIKNLPNFITNQAPDLLNKAIGNGEQIMNSDELPGRDIPVVGSILRGLDTIGNNKYVQNAGAIGREFYIPGASLSNVGGFSDAAESAISNVASKYAPEFASSAAGKATQGFLREASVAAPLSAGQSLAQGNQFGDAAKAGIEGGLLGGAIGGAVPLISEGANRVLNGAVENYLGPLFKSVSETGNTPLENIFNTVDRAGRIPKRLTPLSNDETVDRVMSRIKPDVEQNISVPYENPNELVKYVQNGLADRGDAISLNEIRKVPYDGLVDMADEIRRGKSLYDESIKAANDKGYNLEKLLNNEGPSLKKRVAEDASKRAYGIYPESLPKVIEPITTPAESSNASQSWFSRLFGESNGVGFTPFSSNKSTRMVSTEQQLVKNPLISKVQGIGESLKQGGRAVYQGAVDYLSPIKSISKEAYDAAMDAARANNIANTIVRDKMVDLQGNIIGPSLNDVMKEARGLGKKFDDYLILRHADTRMRRGERVYDEQLQMTPEKAAEKAAQLEQRYPGLKKAGEMWDKLNYDLPHVMGVKEGLLSEGDFQAMKAVNPHYASMKRQFTIGEKLAQPKFSGTGSAFSGQSAPIREVSPTGSVRKIVSPIRSYVEQAYAWTNAALRNRVGQEIVKAIQANPESMAGIARIVKKPTASFNDLREVLKEGGSEAFLDQLENDYKNLFKKHNPGDENVIRVMVKGEPIHVQIDNPEAAKALLGMGAEQSGIVIAALQKLSNATKRGATGVLAPMFAVKNLTADTIQGAIQSPNFIQHIAIDVPHAFFSAIGEALHIPGLKNLAEEFRRAGGEYSSLLRGDRAVNRSVYELRKTAPLSPQGIVKGAYNLTKGTARAFEKLGDITENTNRMAAYKRAMVGQERTPENVRTAINAARESTTNFSRRGSISREVEAAIPYSNAAVQGIYRLGIAIGKNPVKTLAGLGTLVIAPKLYEYAKFNNDPDYQKLPARERYRNLIIGKNDDGTFKKIPMPPEYEAFGALLSDTLDYVINENPEAYKGTLDAIANAWTPPAVSGALQGATQGGGPEQSLAGFANATVAAPFAAVLSNKSFTGAPIDSKAVADRSPQNRYDEKTSSVAKYIGEKMGYSPMKIDYLLRSYGGDPARLLLPLTSDVGGGTPRNTMLRNFIVDPVMTNNLTNDYYGAKESLENAYRDHKEVNASLPAWFDEGLYKSVSSTAKGSISKQLSALSEQKRSISTNAGLSAEQRAQQIRETQRKINDIYTDINAKLYQKGVPMK